MQLFYSGANQTGAIQNLSSDSLGGYLSSSLVPNQSLNNLFSELTVIDYEKNTIETKGLFLRNTRGVPVTNINIHFIYPNENQVCKIEIGAVTIATSTDNKVEMEKIPYAKSIPFAANFFEADGEVNKVLVGDLSVNQYLGLWLKRSIINENNEIDLTEICNAPSGLKELSENIEMIITWDE